MIMPSSYSLGAHFEDFIRSMVESGRYASASEVMRDSLRLLEERETLREAKLAALRTDIEEGLESGPVEPLDMGEIKAAARGERAAKVGTARGAKN
jgi:antitoxin ParD1/3/4